MLKSHKATCVVCHSQADHQFFAVREMYFGSKEAFDYFECADCGTIQIRSIPDDLSRHYPADYYSFSASGRKQSSTLEVSLRRRRTQAWLGGATHLGKAFAALSQRKPEYLGWLSGTGLGVDSSILDVGCGGGQLLLKMQRDGFLHLRGIDPFNAETIDHGNGLCIDRKFLSDEQGRYDLIMFHHSLEHMAEPERVLVDATRILNAQGSILIRTPVAGSYAWRKYREHWFQLDAPRHFFIPTLRSMHLLSQRCGLKIERVFFDSSSSQVIASEAYMRDISMIDMTNGALGAEATDRQAAVSGFIQLLNAAGDGDQAGFVLRKAAGAVNNGR